MKNFVENAILDTDPAVSMSLELGKQVAPGEIIDVDYTALRETLSAVNSPDDNRDLTIDFVSKAELTDASGSYSQNIALIRFNPDRPHAAEKTLQHELKHYSDDRNGTLIERTGAAKVMYNLGAVALDRMVQLAPIPAIGASTALLKNLEGGSTGSPALDALLTGATAMGTATVPAMVGLGIMRRKYSQDPNEIAAFKAEKQNLKPVVSIKTASD